MSEARPTCATCQYYHDHARPATKIGTVIVSHTNSAGDCRRNPPTCASMAMLTEVATIRVREFPPANPGDWCGEHPDFPAWLAAQRPEPQGDGAASDLRTERNILARDCKAFEARATAAEAERDGLLSAVRDGLAAKTAVERERDRYRAALQKARTWLGGIHDHMHGNEDLRDKLRVAIDEVDALAHPPTPDSTDAQARALDGQ